MGRPKKNDLVKKAQGTLRKCRVNRAQMVVDGQLPQNPPPELTPDARSAWTMAVTCAKQFLTPLDHSVLERWCRNYDLYRKLQKDVDYKGAIDEEGKERGAFKALIKVQVVLAKCEDQLGFNPIARQKLKAPSDDSQEKNDFADF